MNINLFKSKMALYGYSRVALAEHMGLSVSRLSAKINAWNGAQFTQAEISSLKDVLKLSDGEVMTIFFGGYVSYKDAGKSESEEEN